MFTCFKLCLQLSDHHILWAKLCAETRIFVMQTRNLWKLLKLYMALEKWDLGIWTDVSWLSSNGRWALWNSSIREAENSGFHQNIQNWVFKNYLKGAHMPGEIFSIESIASEAMESRNPISYALLNNACIFLQGRWRSLWDIENRSAHLFSLFSWSICFPRVLNSSSCSFSSWFSWSIFSFLMRSIFWVNDIKYTFILWCNGLWCISFFQGGPYTNDFILACSSPSSNCPFQSPFFE